MKVISTKIVKKGSKGHRFMKLQLARKNMIIEHMQNGGSAEELRKFGINIVTPV